MSLQLFHLCVSRCPLRGKKYATLLYLCADANDRDVIYMSKTKLSAAMRTTVRLAHETLRDLREDGWLRSLSYGRKHNRSHSYYLIDRLELLKYPIIGPRGAKRANTEVALVEKQIGMEAAARARETARMFHNLLQLRPGEHMPFLRRMAAPDS